MEVCLTFEIRAATIRAVKMIETLHIEKALASMEPPDADAIRASARKIYERPLAFWRGFIGRSLHYHLGHFPLNTVTLDDGMKLAVQTLVDASQRELSGVRVLDVGCGWGGPAEHILDLQAAEVHCVTNSVRQARFVQRRFQNRPAFVKCEDLDRSRFRGIGEFDVILMHESLEHIINQASVLSNLRKLISTDGCLLIATSCTGDSAPFDLYSVSFGVQPLKRLEDLCSTLTEAGWYVIHTMDHTQLTMLSWEKWRKGLRQQLNGAFCQEARELLDVFDITEALYAARMLRSVHVIAFPAEGRDRKSMGEFHATT